MRVLRNLSFILALSSGMAHASNIWLSTSDMASPLGEVPFIKTQTGTDQKIHVWGRPDPDKTLLNLSLNLRSADFDVITFKDFQIYNPVLAEPEGMQTKSMVRYEYVNADEDFVIGPNLITMMAFSIAHLDRIGTGIGPASQHVDPLYDLDNDAWLLASASYNVIGPGRADLYLQIGSAGIQNQGEESSDHNVVFGDPNDARLNGAHNRQADSATPDATIVAQGMPKLSWRQSAKFFAERGENEDNFGRSTSMSEDRIVVGSKFANSAADHSAYVFERSKSSWDHVATLTGSSGELHNTFGASVGISGDRIIVGDDDSDVAYLFEQTGPNWSEVAVIAPSDAGEGREFGRSVGISGDNVVVGAPFDGDRGRNAGSAYIFERINSTWTEVAKLTASDATNDNDFGAAVAVSDDRTIVDAPRKDKIGRDSGAAYIFEKSGDTWTEVAQLIPSDLADRDHFGTSVAMHGDRVVVSAQYHDSNGVNSSGAAYIFERWETGWTEVAQLTASDAAESDYFGTSVAIFEDRVVVGARGDGLSVGSAYVFEPSGSNWNEVAKLVANDAMWRDHFGISVATSGDAVAIGSPGSRYQVTGHGSVYVFVPPEDVAARLVTGSPVSLSQTVDTPAHNFDLKFEYQYLTITGDLDLMLGGVLLGTIEAPTSLHNDFATVSFAVDDALLD